MQAGKQPDTDLGVITFKIQTLFIFMSMSAIVVSVSLMKRGGANLLRMHANA